MCIYICAHLYIYIIYIDMIAYPHKSTALLESGISELILGIDLKDLVAVFIRNHHGHGITCHRENSAMGPLKIFAKIITLAYLLTIYIPTTTTTTTTTTERAQHFAGDCRCVHSLWCETDSMINACKKESSPVAICRGSLF